MSILLSSLRHPFKLFNYLGLRLCYRLNTKRVPFLPVYLDIEPNNTCNFSCPHCQVPHWSKEKIYLSKEDFTRIIDQFPNLLQIKLQGMGEPLLNKDLIDMLEIGEARDIDMYFISNGSIMNDEIIERLLRLRRTRITFSIDGATRETFEEIRKGGNFERVTENIARLTSARGKASKPEITCWTVVTRKNVDELADIVRLARRLALDKITIQTFLTDWGKDSMREFTDALRVKDETSRLEEAIASAIRTAKEIGMDIDINYKDYLSKKHKCEWPWMSAFIASNGDVVPCCIIADSDTVNMGNVFKEDFKEIWNSKDYQRLREMIGAHRLPDFCRNCYIDAGAG